MTLATKGTAISRGSRVAYLRLVLLGVAPWPRSMPSSPSTAAAHQRHRPPEDVMPSNGDHCAWRTRGPGHSWLSLRRCSSGMPCRRACVGGAERVVQVLDADKGEEGMGGPSAAVRRRKAEQTEGGIGRTGGECSGIRRRGKVREGSRIGGQRVRVRDGIYIICFLVGSSRAGLKIYRFKISAARALLAQLATSSWSALFADRLFDADGCITD